MAIKTIQEIYDAYQVLPSLQRHMYLVAGVVCIICDGYEGVDLDKEVAVTLALLHDLGNIIKFDLTMYPEFLEPHGLGYRQKIQIERRNKYQNEHLATVKIAEELGLNDKYLNPLRFFCKKSNGDAIIESGKKELFAVEYGDIRVSPFGVTTMQERTQSQIERDMRNKGWTREYAIQKGKSWSLMASKIESVLFKNNAYSPKDITHPLAEKQLTGLKNRQIMCD